MAVKPLIETIALKTGESILEGTVLFWAGDAQLKPAGSERHGVSLPSSGGGPIALGNGLALLAKAWTVVTLRRVEPAVEAVRVLAASRAATLDPIAPRDRARVLIDEVITIGRASGFPRSSVNSQDASLGFVGADDETFVPVLYIEREKTFALGERAHGVHRLTQSIHKPVKAHYDVALGWLAERPATGSPERGRSLLPVLVEAVARVFEAPWTRPA